MVLWPSTVDITASRNSEFPLHVIIISVFCISVELSTRLGPHCARSCTNIWQKKAACLKKFII